MRKSWILAVSSVAALVLAGCGSSSSNSSGSGTSSSSASGTSSSSSASSSSSSADVSLRTASTSLGTIVVDSSGMTVYYFDKDTANSGTSTCSGECLAAWPAVVATSDSPKVDGVTGTVGTITRDDGTKQVTLNGLPLYLFVKDKVPGDVTGQAVQGVWWVVAPDGTKITAAGGGSSSSSSSGLMPSSGSTY